MKKTRFVIRDWAGNYPLEKYNRSHAAMELSKRIGGCGPVHTFPSFEDAWDFIYCDLTDKLKLTEEDYQEYYVEEVVA
jgi:hypothetical protein